jgi:hypothetical protein
MLTTTLYNPKLSKIAEARGPMAIEQLESLANDTYWTVLGTDYFRHDAIKSNELLCLSVNKFKHLLQTYGPKDATKLPDFRHNEGGAKNYVFHGHVHGPNRTQYIIEWAIIDPENKIMAIVNFRSHENYPFVQKPLNQKAKEHILKHPYNQKIMKNVERARKEAIAKVRKILAHS